MTLPECERAIRWLAREWRFSPELLTAGDDEISFDGFVAWLKARGEAVHLDYLRRLRKPDLARLWFREELRLAG